MRHFSGARPTLILAALILVVVVLAGLGAPAARAQGGNDLAALNAQVVQLYQAGKYAEATEIAKRSLALAEKQSGPDHPSVGTSLNNLAALYESQTMNRGSDLEATPMAGAEWLLASPRCEQIIIADDGRPLRIVAPDPRTFALHKVWVSRRANRSPSKKPRDEAHAALVAQLARTFLGQRLVPKEMPWLPTELRRLMKDAAAMARALE